MSAKTVFISYRRDAVGKLFARLLNDALTHRGYDVFLDVDCINAGKWAEQILTQVPVRSHFLILLTPGAFDRCVSEDDWVRREFEMAVRTGRNIVPVREESVSVADFRKASPPFMEGVFQFQIASARQADFARDVDTLIERFIPPHKAPAPTTELAPSARAFHADISRISKYAPANLQPSSLPARDLVYVSYSHRDNSWHRKLRRILDADPDVRDLVWDDTKIPAGANFAKEIDAHVARARVMIMLGSPDYFGANSGAAKCETQPALEAHRHGEMEILWFPVRAFTYRTSPVGHLMAATGAGAVALEQLSTAEQRKELQRVRQSVRRCLEIPESHELGESSRPKSIQRNMNASTQTRTRKKAPSENMVVRPDISIGIITALPKEFVAMKTLLFDYYEHHVPGQGAGRRYVLGRIPSLNGGDHRVALALGDMGNNIASARAALLLEHFNSVGAIIMVGIAGGVPFPRKVEDHVRLGDIVVSNKKGVVQYDMVKLSEVRACPIAPSAKLIEAVRHLEAGGLEGKRPWDAHVEVVLKQLKQKRPANKTDKLFDSNEPATELTHPKDAKRSARLPRVFLGPVASANELLKDPVKRDSLRDRFGVKAVEMEGSGIADATWLHEKGYLVVRGICDYCDSHKNDLWQEYAAATAAAYVRALIESVFVSEPAARQNPK